MSLAFAFVADPDIRKNLNNTSAVASKEATAAAVSITVTDVHSFPPTSAVVDMDDAADYLDEPGATK